MDDRLARAVEALADRLLTMAGRLEEAGAELRQAADEFRRAAHAPGPSTAQAQAEPEAAIEPQAAIGPEAESAAPAPSPPAPGPGEPLRALTLGQAPRPAEPASSPFATAIVRGAATDGDLAGAAARCRLKAEGMRWAVERRRRIDARADFRAEIAPTDREILDRGRAAECYLWMNSPDFDVPGDSGLAALVADWFAALADALEVALRVMGDPEAGRSAFESSLELVAEAQSALRVAVDAVDARPDADQYLAYDWLRAVTSREKVYIRRHMRIDDPADPWPIDEFRARLAVVDDQSREAGRQAKRRDALVKRFQYHARRIDPRADAGLDWLRLDQVARDLQDARVPPSAPELRDALLPIVEAIPDLPEFDDRSRGLGLILRELDQYLAAQEPADAPPSDEPPTPEVIEAARLLEGRSVVLIGGTRRPGSLESLRDAFRLRELVWVEGKEHASVDRFEPAVARPDVAIVLLAIRWSSHSFGEVKRFCDQYGKPMVRLPGGYNPNQVAVQVLAQCSEQLEPA